LRIVLPIIRAEEFVEHGGIAIDKDAGDGFQHQSFIGCGDIGCCHGNFLSKWTLICII